MLDIEVYDPAIYELNRNRKIEQIRNSLQAIPKLINIDPQSIISFQQMIKYIKRYKVASKRNNSAN